MNKLGTFFLGFLVGGAVVYSALHYHIVRASDGLHLVPKVKSTFSETYVDVRGFTVSDWTDRPALAAAIAHSGKTDIVGDTLQNRLKEVWQQ